MSADPVALAQEVSPRQRGLFLKNLADFQTELARIQAGFGPGFSVWAQRKELPMLVFRTLRRVQDLRLRGRELGVSFAEMHLSEGVAARDLRRALCAANSTADLLQAAMIVVPGVLAEAIDAYLKRNDRIYDLPSVPLLEASREELRTQAAWAKSALEVLAREAGETPDATFVARVQTIAESLPEALETHFDRTPVRVQAGRRMGRLPLAEAVLPAGFRPLPFGPESLSRENEYRDRALELQEDLTQATIENLRAKTYAMTSGQALVKIDGAGLQPHLEAFMWEILKTIQVRVNNDGLDMLVGV